MDAGQVKTFCESAAQLLVEIGAYAALEPAKRSPEDDALVRQLRVATSALNTALETLARVSPSPMPAPQVLAPPMAAKVA
jgi:hypothetical protein